MPEPPRVVLRSRRNCPCSRAARELIRIAQMQYHFAYEEILQDDPDAPLRLEVDGKVRFRHAVNPALFDRLFRSIGAGTTSAPEKD